MQSFLFELSEGICPECGICLNDDYAIYSLRSVTYAHVKRGVCVACTGIDLESSKQGMREVGHAVSMTALYAVWGGRPGFRVTFKPEWDCYRELLSKLDGLISALETAG